MRRIVLLLAVLAAAPARAADLANAPLSLEGFSGMLHTPSAWVHEHGTMHLLVTDAAPTEATRGNGHNLTMVTSLSLVPYLELGGRVTEATAPIGGMRDLSFNGKLQLPLDRLFRRPGLPFAIAFGTQDEGGAAPHFRTRYAVASGRVGPLALSLGYGTGPDRMDGVFGGASLRVLRYADLLADHDARNWSAGVRLGTDLVVLRAPLRVSVLAARTFATGAPDVEWAAEIALPLAGRLARVEEGPRPSPPASRGERGSHLSPSVRPEPVEGRTAGGPAAAQSSVRPEPVEGRTGLRSLLNRLEETGLENLRVGEAGDAVVVEYENDVWRHSESDGLGVVLGLVALEAPERLKTFRVRILRAQVVVAELEGPLDALRAYFLGPASVRTGSPDSVRPEPVEGRTSAADRTGEMESVRPEPVEGRTSIADLASVLKVTIRPASRPVEWLEDGRRRWTILRPRVGVSPALRTLIATEIGLFEWLASVQPDVTVPLWRGATGQVRWDIPLAWSETFGPGGTFRRDREDARMLDALVYQAIPLARGFTLLAGAGVLLSSEAGGVGQLHWTEPRGRFALGVEGASSRDMWDSAVEHTALTGSGQVHLPWLDVLAEVRAGKFLGGDRGASVRVSRFFGDTRVGFFYSHTDVRMAGFQIGLPLTPRREMRPGLVQLRGDNRFSQGVGTVVGEDRNPVRFGVAVSPLTRFNVQETFLDANRLGRDGVLADLPRMRATFLREIDGDAARCEPAAP